MLGDVNISAILDSFSVSYDKRVRPNYGGEYDDVFTKSYFQTCRTLTVSDDSARGGCPKRHALGC